MTWQTVKILELQAFSSRKRPILIDFNFKKLDKKEESSLSPPRPLCPRATTRVRPTWFP